MNQWMNLLNALIGALFATDDMGFGRVPSEYPELRKRFPGETHQGIQVYTGNEFLLWVHVVYAPLLSKPTITVIKRNGACLEYDSYDSAAAEIIAEGELYKD